MRILIMGAGAMGSVLGGFLANAGHTVTLIGRAPHMSAVRDHGLRISGIWGDHFVRSLTVKTDASGLSRGDFDWMFITVKAYDTRAAVRLIAPLVDTETLVCSYQNGLGNAEAIAETLGWERTVGARVIFGVRLVESGHAEVTVIANPTALGAYSPDADVGRVNEMVAAMEASGLPTVYTEEIDTLLWGKVAYNCALNPLSALLDVPYGRLADFEDTRAIMEKVVAELYAVAQARGVRLRPATAAGYVRHLFEELIPPTAAHYASMREDLKRGRRTEIDALNGAIARYGREHGVPCPTNATLTRLVRAYELIGASR